MPSPAAEPEEKNDDVEPLPSHLSFAATLCGVDRYHYSKPHDAYAFTRTRAYAHTAVLTGIFFHSHARTHLRTRMYTHAHWQSKEQSLGGYAVQNCPSRPHSAVWRCITFSPAQNRTRTHSRTRT